MITSQSHRKVSRAGVGQGAGGREVWLKCLSGCDVLAIWLRLRQEHVGCGFGWGGGRVT